MSGAAWSTVSWLLLITGDWSQRAAFSSSGRSACVWSQSSCTQFSVPYWSWQLWQGQILEDWTFWHRCSVSCVLCSVVWLKIATGLPSRQGKSPESRGVVGKPVLLHLIKEGVENYFKRCWNGKMLSEQMFHFYGESKELWTWLSKCTRNPLTWGTVEMRHKYMAYPTTPPTLSLLINVSQPANYLSAVLVSPD